MRDPEGIGPLVGKVAGDLGLAEVLAAGRLFRQWDQVVGPQIAARSRPLSLRSGVLRIQTHSAAWAAEVRYLAPELLRRANEALGAAVARELQVVVRPGSDGREAPEASPRRRSGGRETGGPGPSKPTRSASDATLPIKDPELADAVARVLDAARSRPRDNKGRKEAR